MNRSLWRGKWDVVTETFTRTTVHNLVTPSKEGDYLPYPRVPLTYLYFVPLANSGGR
jgi:hypothetical protein